MSFSRAMQMRAKRSFTSVRADAAGSSGRFGRGLLDPASPLPENLHGPANKRFAVYRNNVTVSLVRAMETNFPVVRRLLGNTYFAGLAREYVQKHPPQSPLMFFYGTDFSSFLEAEEDLRDYPYLGDIARLEQQLRHSYHETDAPCLAVTELSHLSEHELMELVLTPHPAMALVSSAFAIHAIYLANQTETPAPVVDVLQSQSILLTRPLHDVQLHGVSNASLIFLRALSDKNALGDAANSALQADDAFDLVAAINLMVASGAFQSMQHPKIQV
jgi:Putative DNA-binding domain